MFGWDQFPRIDAGAAVGFRQAVQPKACCLTAAHLQSPTLIMHCVDHLLSLVPHVVPRATEVADAIACQFSSTGGGSNAESRRGSPGGSAGVLIAPMARRYSSCVCT